METEKAARTPKGRCHNKSLAKAIRAILMPTNAEEQRVATNVLIEFPPSDNTPIMTIQQILDALAIMQMWNPMVKRNLITTTCIHRRQPQKYTPGALPKITRVAPVLTLIAMTLQEALTLPISFMPRKLVPSTYDTCSTKYAHFAAPMIHPSTGKIISSYKHLMNDPNTAEVWQPAFGKDFGGMAQRDLKTGQKGTNSVFVVMVAGHKWTYTRNVVDHQPPKEDPNQIRIAVDGILITDKGSTSTRTANLTTSNAVKQRAQLKRCAIYVP
jgi:hypothetical protein